MTSMVMMMMMCDGLMDTLFTIDEDQDPTPMID
jgi:hypothetical protein